MTALRFKQQKSSFAAAEMFSPYRKWKPSVSSRKYKLCCVLTAHNTRHNITRISNLVGNFRIINFLSFLYLLFIYCRHSLMSVSIKNRYNMQTHNLKIPPVKPRQKLCYFQVHVNMLAQEVHPKIVVLTSHKSLDKISNRSSSLHFIFKMLSNSNVFSNACDNLSLILSLGKVFVQN